MCPMRYRHNQKGYTLIELMITIAIIGILAALAMSKFSDFDCKAKQSEAKTNLGTIRSCEEAYFAEYDRYAQNTLTLGFVAKGDTRYSYSIASADPFADFTATATGNTKMTRGGTADRWTIDQDGLIDNPDNVCQ